jgi:hypothetical protein
MLTFTKKSVLTWCRNYDELYETTTTTTEAGTSRTREGTARVAPMGASSTTIDESFGIRGGRNSLRATCELIISLGVQTECATD